MKKRIAHRRSRKGYHIQWRYGLAPEEYGIMLENQQGCCAICGKAVPPTKRGRDGLYVDHNHTTGKVRGLLCARCNTLMSFLDQPDWPELLSKAQAYDKD